MWERGRRTSLPSSPPSCSALRLLLPPSRLPPALPGGELRQWGSACPGAPPALLRVPAPWLCGSCASASRRCCGRLLGKILAARSPGKLRTLWEAAAVGSGRMSGHGDTGARPPSTHSLAGVYSPPGRPRGRGCSYLCPSQRGCGEPSHQGGPQARCKPPLRSRLGSREPGVPKPRGRGSARGRRSRGAPGLGSRTSQIVGEKAGSAGGRCPVCEYRGTCQDPSSPARVGIASRARGAGEGGWRQVAPPPRPVGVPSPLSPGCRWDLCPRALSVSGGVFGNRVLRSSLRGRRG